MIAEFDTILTKYTEEFNEEIDPFVKEGFDDLKAFFQERLDAQMEETSRYSLKNYIQAIWLNPKDMPKIFNNNLKIFGVIVN